VDANPVGASMGSLLVSGKHGMQMDQNPSQRRPFVNHQRTITEPVL
jgi:hypothetical protein